MRPHQPVHWKPVLVVAQYERVRGQCHAAPCRLVLKGGEPIGEGKQEGDAHGAVGSRGDDEIVHAPQRFDAVLLQRYADHSVGGEKHRIGVTGGNTCSLRIAEKVGYVRLSHIRLLRRDTAAGCLAIIGPSVCRS